MVTYTPDDFLADPVDPEDKAAQAYGRAIVAMMVAGAVFFALAAHFQGLI
jgi:hypothetical protein